MEWKVELKDELARFCSHIGYAIVYWKLETTAYPETPTPPIPQV